MAQDPVTDPEDPAKTPPAGPNQGPESFTPRQIPKTGILPKKCLTVCTT